ncbi:NADP-dependent oxidoreductase, partial [Oxalobacteraceae bacterium OM1]
SLPLVALTTVQALVDRAKARPGQRILIHAGSGGLGSFAIQYAHRVLGLHVTTTTSSRNAEWVGALGAERVICYDREDYLQDAARYDIVFDTLGGKTTADSFRVVKPAGVVVSVAGPPDRDFARQVGAGPLVRVAMHFMNRPIYRLARQAKARYFRFLTESDGEQLGRIAAVVESGKVKPVIDRSYPFLQLVQAMEAVAAGRSKGKVVLEW